MNTVIESPMISYPVKAYVRAAVTQRNWQGHYVSPLPLLVEIVRELRIKERRKIPADLEKKVEHCLRNTKDDTREPMYHQNSKGMWGFRIAKANVLAFYDPPVVLDE